MLIREVFIMTEEKQDMFGNTPKANKSHSFNTLINPCKISVENRIIMLLATIAAGCAGALLLIAISCYLGDYYKITFAIIGIVCGLTAVRYDVYDNIFTRRSAVVISIIFMIWGIFATVMLLETELNTFSFDSLYHLIHQHTLENFLSFLKDFFGDDEYDFFEVILTGIFAYYFAVDVTDKQVG